MARKKLLLDNATIEDIIDRLKQKEKKYPSVLEVKTYVMGEIGMAMFDSISSNHHKDGALPDLTVKDINYIAEAAFLYLKEHYILIRKK